MSDLKPVLAVIGGTGSLGSGLARRWSAAGYAVIVGSRTKAKAAETAARLASAPGASQTIGATNAEATSRADIVIVTVPFASQAEILAEIKPHIGTRLVVDTTVPLVPPKVARVQLPPSGSAAMSARALLGDGVRLASAFHNVAAHKLQSDAPIDCDVLVFADEPKEREIVITLARAAGLRGIHGGPLANSAAAEAMTSVLIGINRSYKVDGAGLRITGPALA